MWSGQEHKKRHQVFRLSTPANKEIQANAILTCASTLTPISHIYGMIIMQNSIKPLGLSSNEASGSGQYKITKLPYQVLGERLEFWNDDDIGMFYAYLPPPTSSNMSTIIRIMDDKGSILDKVILPYSQTTNRFSFQVKVENLSDGDFSAEAYISHPTAEGSGGLVSNGQAAVQAKYHYIASTEAEMILAGESLSDFTTNTKFAADGLATLDGAADCRFATRVKFKFTGGGWTKLLGAASCRFATRKNFKFTAGGWTKLQGTASAPVGFKFGDKVK